MARTKICDLIRLKQRALDLRKAGKRLVLCHGTFDLLHVGHIRHLATAAEHGDVLVVTLTADAHVHKGPGRPVFNQDLRAESLAALEQVSHVAIVDHITALPAIEAVQPHVYVKGGEYRTAADDVTGNITREMDAVKRGGGTTVFTDDITFSSSKLLNEHFSVFPPEIKEWLRLFATEHNSAEVINSLKSLLDLKVCVFGDAIVDEYHYTDPMGQTGKGNIMAARHVDIERFAGGSLAVANHIAGFCRDVTLVTGLGALDTQEAFIREKLNPNVTPHFFYREDAPTVRKTRFTDQDANKLFEVYYYEPAEPPRAFEDAVCQWLRENLNTFDVVIVPDFGNGLITDRMTTELVAHARFLAVNTQVNSGNRGYHTVKRYSRAHYVSLNEPELRLALHDRHGPLEAVARKVADRVGAEQLAVTLGTRGLCMYDRPSDRFLQVPALSIKVVDRIGAGDAFLAVSGIALGGGLSAPLAAFAGAVAAALDVQIVCNREPVDPVSLFKYVTTLLK